ncbi:hypothetical protein MKX01_032837, partial [Papaver californicum]
GLQEKIKLVPIDLPNRPDWYKEKVYPPNKGGKSGRIVNCILALKSYSEDNRQLHSEDVLYRLHLEA